MNVSCGGRAQNIHEFVSPSPGSITNTQENSTYTEKWFVLENSQFWEIQSISNCIAAPEPVV